MVRAPKINILKLGKNKNLKQSTAYLNTHRLLLSIFSFIFNKCSLSKYTFSLVFCVTSSKKKSWLFSYMCYSSCVIIIISCFLTKTYSHRSAKSCTYYQQQDGWLSLISIMQRSFLACNPLFYKRLWALSNCPPSLLINPLFITAALYNTVKSCCHWSNNLSLCAHILSPLFLSISLTGYWSSFHSNMSFILCNMPACLPFCWTNEIA